MASATTYTVTSDPVGIRLSPITREIILQVGDCEVRLSPDEFRSINERAKEMLSEHAAACAELGL